MSRLRFSAVHLLLLAALLAFPAPMLAQTAPRTRPAPPAPTSVKPAESSLRTTTPPPAVPAPDDLLLPPSGPRLTAVPIRLKLAASDPAPSAAATPSSFGITTLEVRTPVPNLWFGLTDLSLPLAPATLRESPSSLLDTLSSSTPVLTYRLNF